MILGGVDINGPHLYTIYPHGSTDKLPYVTMGSGSLAAMSVFESRYVANMEVSCIMFSFDPLQKQPHYETDRVFLRILHSVKTPSHWCRMQLRLVFSMIWDLDPTSMLLLSTVRRSKFSATTLDPTSAVSRKQGKHTVELSRLALMKDI